MNKGIIATNYKHNVVVLHEFIDDGGRVVYEEIPLHPYFKNYKSFVLGEEVLFQYTNECTIHYPEYCDCYKKKMFALIVPSKRVSKLTLIKNKLKQWLNL